MKSIIIIFTFLLISFVSFGKYNGLEIKEIDRKNQSFINNATKSETLSQKGRKTKDGRYKRKKGFMWGLFKSKKECDCPKN